MRGARSNALRLIITVMGSSPSPPRRDRAGRSSPRLDRETPYLRIEAIAIFVRDLIRSLRFYVDQLGFSLVFDPRLRSGQQFRGSHAVPQWVVVAPPDGASVLTLVAPKPESREYKLIGRSTHVFFVTEDVMATFLEWRKRGVRFSYAPRLRRITYERQAPASPPERGSAAPTEQTPVWGGVFTRFKDLDGNSFGLMGFDALSRELEAQRRAMAEKLESERRAAQELEIAKQVQARLFPQRLPPLKTLDYAGICIQARAVGGDYYDFLDLGRERLGLVIGDISGKGIAAALLMANLQANLRSQCAIAIEQPEQLLQSVNRLFYENTADNAYATLVYAEFDATTGRLRYANCGHLPGLLLRADDTVERLPSTAPVLGLFSDWNCSTGQRQLLPGDLFAIYTDGITEAFNPLEQEFREDRLVDTLQRLR